MQDIQKIYKPRHLYALRHYGILCFIHICKKYTAFSGIKFLLIKSLEKLLCSKEQNVAYSGHN